MGVITWKLTKRCSTIQALTGHLGILFLQTRNGLPTCMISEIIVSQIKKLDLKYPVLSKEQREALEKAKAELEKE